jgi:putative RNA 2'-phosphotransferase
MDPSAASLIPARPDDDPPGAGTTRMSKTRSPQNLAKMLAYVLGRQPDEFALIPDAEGFVKIKDLLKALHEEDGWGYVNESHLQEVVFTVPAPAFEIDAQRIRACKRLALNVEPPTDRPPKLLYAHVRRRAYPWVYANGIRPSSHSHVVLAAQLAIAERLGRRIDPDPVILTVNVRAAEQQGVAFARFGAGLFLAEQIPAGCFSGPPLPAETPSDFRKLRRPHDGAEPPAAPGSYLMDMEKAMAPQVPASMQRRDRKGLKIDPKRRKRGRWVRKKPPWKEC